MWEAIKHYETHNIQHDAQLINWPSSSATPVFPQNWSEMEYRWLQLIIIIFVSVLDLSYAFYDTYGSATPSNVRHTLLCSFSRLSTLM